MYKPFSVKAFGATLVLANFVVDIFDRKSENWVFRVVAKNSTIGELALAR